MVMQSSGLFDVLQAIFPPRLDLLHSLVTLDTSIHAINRCLAGEPETNDLRWQITSVIKCCLSGVGWWDAVRNRLLSYSQFPSLTLSLVIYFIPFSRTNKTNDITAEYEIQLCMLMPLSAMEGRLHLVLGDRGPGFCLLGDLPGLR